MNKKQVLLHIPHSSTYIADEYKQLFFEHVDIEKEIIIMTDLYTEDLFDIDYEKIIFPHSRLVCDVERFRDKEIEEMSQVGMWICYEKTNDLQPLKVVTKNHEKEILAIYDDHHRKFEMKVEEILDSFERVIIIDCHSFSSKPLEYEIGNFDIRPDICLGVDSFHTSTKLVKSLQDNFVIEGFGVKINAPFSGTIVPLKYYNENPNVLSVMIEVNRGLYLNEQTGAQNANYEIVKEKIRRAIAKTVEMM